ncbi:MAG: hypothetical protein GVY22_04160 [Gammaproteobacteria bacterium]|jgi:hypothetical protein|nr:hypothetical protein [Gammaproteobacteria bacterium]
MTCRRSTSTPIWWAAKEGGRRYWPDDPAQRARILSDFDGDFGDRRQQLVFIGQHLERDAMRARLDDCLLTDDELAAGPAVWRAFPDPFPAWVRDAEH